MVLLTYPVAYAIAFFMNGPKEYDDPETEGWNSRDTHEDEYYDDEEDGTPDGDIGMNPAE